MEPNFDFSSIINNAKELFTPTYGDSKVKDEILDYETESKLHDLNYKREFLDARKRMMRFTKRLVSIWLFVMLSFVFFDGICRVPFTNIEFKSSENVIITLITTTTINVLGCLLIVIHNLFPANERNSASKIV